jgi:hypothetical protein
VTLGAGPANLLGLELQDRKRSLQVEEAERDQLMEQLRTRGERDSAADSWRSALFRYQLELGSARSSVRNGRTRDETMKILNRLDPRQRVEPKREEEARAKYERMRNLTLSDLSESNGDR